MTPAEAAKHIDRARRKPGIPRKQPRRNDWRRLCSYAFRSSWKVGSSAALDADRASEQDLKVGLDALLISPEARIIFD